MAKVVTTDGAVLKATMGDKAKTPLNDAQAESVFNEANAKAEKLGIKTRYEVRA